MKSLINNLKSKIKAIFNDVLLKNCKKKHNFRPRIHILPTSSLFIGIEFVHIYQTYNLMKTWYTLSLSLLFLLPLHAQDWNLETYDGIPSKNKKIAFFDDFSGTDKSWKKSDFQNTLNSMDKGECLVESKQSEQIFWQDLIMDKGGFELEVRIASQKAKTKEPITIVLAGSKENMLTFEIKPEGTYRADVTKNGAETDFIGEQASTSIKTDYNKITIRQFNNEIYFFINEQLVANRPFPPLTGYRFGILVTPKNPVIVDYFLMNHLLETKGSADFSSEKGGESTLTKEERSRHKMD